MEGWREMRRDPMPESGSVGELNSSCAETSPTRPGGTSPSSARHEALRAIAPATTETTMDTTQIIYWITEREEIHYRRACGTDSVQPLSQPGGGDVGQV